MGWQTSSHTLENNIMGTLNVLEAIVDLGLEAKVVFASSAAVYGEPLFTPVTEDHPTNPISPYGISKLAAEKLAIAYFKEFGIDAVAIRIFNTYGPRQPRYVIYELLRKLRTSPTRLQVLGTPITVRDYCYVSDMVDALILASTKGVGGEVYNVSGESPVNIGHLVELILAELGLTNKVDVQYTGHYWKGDIRRMIGDISKIKKLGFLPKTPIEEGLKQMLESSWWKSDLH
jgi:UDP-glucose 4-epimerase